SLCHRGAAVRRRQGVAVQAAHRPAARSAALAGLAGALRGVGLPLAERAAGAAGGERPQAAEVSMAGEEQRPAPRRAGSDVPFLLALAVIGGAYVLLIVAMLVADAFFTSPQHILGALASPEIQYAIRLSLVSCSITA